MEKQKEGILNGRDEEIRKGRHGGKERGNNQRDEQKIKRWKEEDEIGDKKMKGRRCI